ncbi:MAG: winged helix-turn-helix domain-containing protein [Muribaculaceae bacterium]|nr:winged helix-turn-helix domain-containing protein [Muribaculaceae bacterium]MDE6094220.1 winged helix-turn-helix domain-containing protein [Muribaculaceae bacterium]MDE6344854.1 winged helix-turn-helix domain-containing protein [Muribaculaceae bacterium]MDE6503232.1 winged helix-turn-helix domain-containing protein [Muribaculaceae bacterium]MDE6610354.1 winged helix-turn-helix domain-containing protein [Muribaculaceae bacterium]
MNVENIGTWAGLVWTALSEADVLGVKQLKKITKLKDKEVFAALGWLARENKITLHPDEADGKEILVALVPEN